MSESYKKLISEQGFRYGMIYDAISDMYIVDKYDNYRRLIKFANATSNLTINKDGFKILRMLNRDFEKYNDMILEYITT